jgi:hypothetical protein
LWFDVTASFAGGNVPYNNGNEVLSELMLPVYACPSSVIKPFDNPHSWSNPDKGQNILYVGIQGAARPIPGPSPNKGTRDCSHGWSCNNGMLAPNECFCFKDATDGTSNTMLVSEQSGLTNGQNLTSNYYGGWFGTRHPRTIEDSAGCGDLWQTGTTCVRFAPNSDIIQTGATDRMWRNNTILNSEHPGGVQVVLTDGSVNFISDTIDFINLKRLACRYDGEPVQPF